VLQSYIFEDEELLKYVLIHELTHIKKFDIAFSHLKNLIMCINWYNPFILGAAKYIEDDIEMLCDKLVIKKVGDTGEHRKEYCMAMLKLTERNENSRFVLKLHPTKERIIVMKKWRRTVSGMVALAVAVGVSMTSFVEVRAIETNQVVANVESFYAPINEDNKVEEITEKEYRKLMENQAEIVPYIADINEFSNVDLILSLYTLQFLPLWKRKQVLQRIYKGLVEGGAFILVEKIRAENSMFEDIWTDLYWDFKQDSGLNEQQVIKKSQSLRGVLMPLTLSENLRLLSDTGFQCMDTFIKWNNFAGIIAVKMFSKNNLIGNKEFEIKNKQKLETK